MGRRTDLPMQPGIEAMTTALRVLSAITYGRIPDPADLKALRGYTPLLGDRAPDELACEVIKQELRRHLEEHVARAKAG